MGKSKGKRTAVASSEPTSRRPPVAQAAAARQNERKRTKKLNQKTKLAAAGCALVVVVAVALHFAGWLDGEESGGAIGGQKRDPWRTVRFLAEKWGDENTVQKFRDFQTVLKLHSIDDYMTQIHSDPFYEPVRDSCNLRSEWCAEMATKGLCPDYGIYELNSHGLSPVGASNFMENNCLPACKLCHLSSHETRCPFDRKSIVRSDVLKGPGELNSMFKRMLAEDFHKQYGPIQVHSKPGGDEVEKVFNGPWVVTFENFLTPEECARVRALGALSGNGFQRSKTGVNPVDNTNVRTSSTNWCMKEDYRECHSDPIIRQIHHRVESITGINESNYEYLQILRYEEGDYYKEHHDFNPVEVNRAQGVRLLTVFLYLNDVETGGGTHFPNIGGEEGITILPKQGKALIWPSVLDSNPNEEDPRTRHAALKVEKGMKYGANVWIHQRDHKTPFGKNCQ